MSLRWFYPSAPWTSEHHQKVRLYNNVMPLVHAAAIMRCDKTKLTNLCKGNRISFAPKVHGIEYSAYLYVDDFPNLLRSLGWSQSDIDKGMAQIYEVINRAPSTRGGNRRVKEKKQQEEVEEVEEVEEQDEDQEDSLPSRKRPMANEAAAAAPDWLKELYAHIDKTFENCFAMVGPQVVPFYFGTKKWKTEKPAIIQAHLTQIMPGLVAQVCASLEKTMAPQVERELRQRMEREFEKNMEKEDALEMIQHLRKMAEPVEAEVLSEITAAAAAAATKAQQGDEYDDDAEVHAFLKQYYAKNHTE